MKIFQKVVEAFLVYYYAKPPHFNFVLLDHNCSPEFCNKNLPFFIALRCYSYSPLHYQSESILCYIQAVKISIKLDKTSTDSVAVQLLLQVSL